MPSKLTVRLSAWIGLLIVVSFLVNGWIVDRNSRTAFIEIQQQTAGETSERQATAEQTHRLQQAFEKGGWPGVKAELNRQALTDPAMQTVVFTNADHAAASNDVRFSKAKIRELDNGMFQIFGVHADRGHQDEYELEVDQIWELSGANGEVWGRWVRLPGKSVLRQEQKFARRVWQASWAWLSGILGLSVLGTFFLVRKALAPLQMLTDAANQIRLGNFPPPLLSTSGDFEPLTAAINAASSELEKTDAIRKQLIADIAHELRTPLTNLNVLLEAVEQKLAPADEDWLTAMRSETSLLQRLTDDFQQLATMDAGALKVSVQEVPLRETLENLLKPLIAGRAVELELSVSKSMMVRADVERLKQVVGILFDNSLRHGPSHLKLTLTGIQRANQVGFSFSDNGPGVAETDQLHVFKRFFRADPSRNRASGGSGLGLAIAKSLVEAMAGSIHYVHRSESGATFEILLPTC